LYPDNQFHPSILTKKEPSRLLLTTAFLLVVFAFFTGSQEKRREKFSERRLKKKQIQVKASEGNSRSSRTLGYTKYYMMMAVPDTFSFFLSNSLSLIVRESYDDVHVQSQEKLVLFKLIVMSLQFIKKPCYYD